MKKMFVAVLLISVAAACGSKKPAAAPQDKAQLERKDDATGGATYGGRDATQPTKDAPDPDAPR
jgi:hypothetical protein